MLHKFKNSQLTKEVSANVKGGRRPLIHNCGELYESLQAAIADGNYAVAESIRRQMLNGGC